ACSAVGCAGPLKQWGAETSLISRSESFSRASLQQDTSIVLNAVVSFGLEGYAPPVSRSVHDVLSEVPRGLRVLTPRQTLSGINRAGLVRAYSEAVVDYAVTGILNHETLEKIVTALNARYAFQPVMAAFHADYFVAAVCLRAAPVSDARLNASAVGPD